MFRNKKGQTMTDNVIIFGAGASDAAGIPMMNGFVKRMWEFSVRQMNNGEALSDEDKGIFNSAIKVANQLNEYHGRANFDDRNIEDILSILSFNAIGGKAYSSIKLDSIVNAIARTIELTCSINHDGDTSVIQNTGNNIYMEFWQSLFKRFPPSKSFPTIITFNYDLVLERALFQTLAGTTYNTQDKPFFYDTIELQYHFEHVQDQIYEVIEKVYPVDQRSPRRGTTLRWSGQKSPIRNAKIEILKLHGSLNFPSDEKAKTPFNVVKSVDDPYLQPPIFNKLSITDARSMWKTAMNRLRETKNVVIVGYSLPKTDIYMQYFLKAALGPNLDLNKITVFDPVLFHSKDKGIAMKERYEECFSPQLRESRIDFSPGVNHSYEVDTSSGKFHHFVKLIHDENAEIFF